MVGVLGPVVGQAVTLQRMATPSQIVVNRNTYRRAREAFAMTALAEARQIHSTTMV